MNPNPHKTLLERAEEFDIAAKVAFDKHDIEFEKELSNHAFLLRMQAKERNEPTFHYSGTNS